MKSSVDVVGNGNIYCGLFSITSVVKYSKVVGKVFYNAFLKISVVKQYSRRDDKRKSLRTWQLQVHTNITLPL